MIKDADLRFDTYTNSSPHVQMRVTHIPTGVRVDGKCVQGEQCSLRQRLVSELEAKVRDVVTG